MIGTIFSLFVGGWHFLGWLPLLVAPAAVIGASFCKPMLKVLLIAVAILLVGGYVAVVKLDLAEAQTKIATLQGQLQTAEDGERTLQTLVNGNQAVFDQATRNYQANIRALTAQRDAAIAQASQISTTRGLINADAAACKAPLHPSLVDALNFLRGSGIAPANSGPPRPSS
jgi:hypothetical protein